MRERLQLPCVSGRWTVFWLLVCFILTGVLIPLILKLPKWIEFEIVVGIWWLLWAMILTKLLYTGEQVLDDHSLKKPNDWLGIGNAGDVSGCGGDSEGCVVLLGLVVALILVWFLIEIAIPLVFFLLYFLIRAMLAHVINERPSCQGNLVYSLFRGLLWATLYTLPLAGSIWAIHWMMVKKGG